MRKNYFVIICTILFLIMVTIAGIMFTKLENIKNIDKNLSPSIEKDKTNKVKKFDLVNISIGEKTIKKPLFDNEILDEYIDAFININSCDTFAFGIDYLTTDIVNLNLSCTNIKENKIYNLKNSTFVEFKELIKDEISFKNTVYNLLNLKYPKFVTDEVDIVNSKYTIKNNSIELSYETISYGIVTLIINNNEIKNILNYNMEYDKEYQNEFYILDPSKKTIAFTFDDGPSTYDLEIIKALKESHATATFFIVGSRINNYQRSIHSMIDNNMEVGSHSYNHKYLSKINNESILYELNETNNSFKNITGKELKLLRPPYGSFKENIHSLSGMPIILWSVDTLDWKYRDSKKVYNSILNNLKDGDIVLMHSLFESTKDAVIKVLPELYKRGYQVVSVSELAKIKGVNIESGKVYRAF